MNDLCQCGSSYITLCLVIVCVCRSVAYQVCVVSASIVQLSFVNDNPGLTRILHNTLCFFNPLYPLMGCLNSITKATFLPSLYEEDFLWKNLLIAVLSVSSRKCPGHYSRNRSQSTEMLRCNMDWVCWLLCVWQEIISVSYSILAYQYFCRQTYSTSHTLFLPSPICSASCYCSCCAGWRSATEGGP